MNAMVAPLQDKDRLMEPFLVLPGPLAEISVGCYFYNFEIGGIVLLLYLRKRLNKLKIRFTLACQLAISFVQCSTICTLLSLAYFLLPM